METWLLLLKSRPVSANSSPSWPNHDPCVGARFPNARSSTARRVARAPMISRPVTVLTTSPTQTVAGKTRSRFLTAEPAAVAQQQIAAGRKFRERLDTYWEACEEWAGAQMALRPAASSGRGQKKDWTQR